MFPIRLDKEIEQELDLLAKTRGSNRSAVVREAILQDSGAQVLELRAKAATIEANLAGEEYELKLTEAEAHKTKRFADIDKLVENHPGQGTADDETYKSLYKQPT